jgi:hypothetical protein
MASGGGEAGGGWDRRLAGTVTWAGRDGGEEFWTASRRMLKAGAGLRRAAVWVANGEKNRPAPSAPPPFPP